MQDRNQSPLKTAGPRKFKKLFNTEDIRDSEVDDYTPTSNYKHSRNSVILLDNDDDTPQQLSGSSIDTQNVIKIKKGLIDFKA